MVHFFYHRSYNGEGGVSNMAIISVRMVSGWAADPASLKSLMKAEDPVVARYEIDEDGTVQLYFNQVKYIDTIGESHTLHLS